VKAGIKNYLSNFKNILILLLVSNLIFLLVYRFYLHSFVIEIISSKADILDVKYYRGIFENLEYAVLIIVIIVLLVLVKYESIKKHIIRVLSNNNLLIFCVISNICIQFLLLLLITPEPISDSKFYINQANLLFETRSYVSSQGNLTAFWPVGLPAYLTFLRSISTHFLLIAKYINILISTGLIIICYFVFRNYLSVFALNVFLVVFTFFPNNFFSSNVILTDYPFTFFLWGSILAMIVLQKKPSIWLAVLIGILCAVASYLRSTGILLPFLCGGILFLKKCPGRRVYGLIIISVFLLILLPWSIRNFNLFHSVVPVSTNGGYIFLMGNHTNSSGGVNFNFEYDMSNPNEAEESRKAYSEAFNDIIINPVEFLIRIPEKILQTYYRGDSSITWGFKLVNEAIPPLLISLIFYITNLSFYLIILLNILVIFLLRKKIKFKKYVELILISIYILLIIVIFVGSERYHIPLIPIHIFLVAKYFEGKTNKIVA